MVKGLRKQKWEAGEIMLGAGKKKKNISKAVISRRGGGEEREGWEFQGLCVFTHGTTV